MTEKEILKAEIDKIDNENTIEKILCFVVGISTQQRIGQSINSSKQITISDYKENQSRQKEPVIQST